MNKPMIRAQVRIHHDEDPILHAILSPLTGIARTRRIRQLVRAGVLAEKGLGLSTHTEQIKSSVPSPDVRTSSSDKILTNPDDSASEGNGHLPAAFFIPPTSMGSAQ